MKSKALLTALLVSLTSIVFAQTEQGKLMVSGRTSLDFAYSKTKMGGSSIPDNGEVSQDSYNFSLMPALGYFVIDDFAVTLQTSYAINNGKTDNQMSQLTLMPGVIYYIPTGSIVRPFVELGGGYANISTKTPLTSGGKATNSFNGYTIGGGVGAAFFIKENIAIELSGQYASVRTKFSGDSSIKMNISGFSGGIGFSLFF